MIKIITFLGKSISHFLCEKKVIAEQEVEVYQYGFEILISTTLGLLITMAIGIVLNMFFVSILYYVIFVMVRQWTGGYHADSYLKCNITFAGITFFTLGMTKLSDMSEMYSLTIRTGRKSEQAFNKGTKEKESQSSFHCCNYFGSIKLWFIYIFS